VEMATFAAVDALAAVHRAYHLHSDRVLDALRAVASGHMPSVFAQIGG
jgi:hypothetical protein